MNIEDVFEIENRGVIVVGNVASDMVTAPDFTLSAGDSMTVELPDGNTRSVSVVGFDVFRPPLGTPHGETPTHRGVGILVDGIKSKSEIPDNSTIRYDGSSSCPQSADGG